MVRRLTKKAKKIAQAGIGLGVSTAVVAGVERSSGVSVGGAAGLRTVSGFFPIAVTASVGFGALKSVQQLQKKKKKRRGLF